MFSAQAEELRLATENLHNCSAIFRDTVQVREEYGGQVVWDGVVHVLGIEGHKQASTCYSWSSTIEGSDKKRFYAVLKIPPVDSAQAAVRAAIVADYKSGRSA